MDYGQEASSKVEHLFLYLCEMAQIKAKPTAKLSEEELILDLSLLHDDTELVTRSYLDTGDGGEKEDCSPSSLLTVRAPVFCVCPAPDASLNGWLLEGWDDFNSPLNVREVRAETGGQAGHNRHVRFADDAARVAALEGWRPVREEWAHTQKDLSIVRELFKKLYSCRGRLQRDSETIELMAGFGFIKSRAGDVDYPILLKRVDIEFDADANTFSIVDTDERSEINSQLLSSLEGIDERAIGEAEDELSEEDFQPFDYNETSRFLKRLAHSLCSTCEFSESPRAKFVDQNANYLVYLRGAFLVRKKLDGTERAIKGILAAIHEGIEVPTHLLQIVGGGMVDPPEEPKELSIEEQLAEVGGEARDILLTKEANREQLEIARRIEQYAAVLVQGPPGTGKTHTIANLMGNFLAQGKSVLVTSYTKKALAVVKDKLDPKLQGMCVSKIGDSTADMERSVSAISEKMSAHTSAELTKRAQQADEEREQVISELADVRKRIFEALNSEYASITYEGEAYSPFDAAQFVDENAGLDELIPGDVKPGQPFPLTAAELERLYSSNRDVPHQAEAELAGDLPLPSSIPSPVAFKGWCASLGADVAQLLELATRNGWSVEMGDTGLPQSVVISGRSTSLGNVDCADVDGLTRQMNKLHDLEDWQVQVIADGRMGGARRQRWEDLVQSVDDAVDALDSSLSMLKDRPIELPDVPLSALCETLEKASTKFSASGRISSFHFIVDRKLDRTLLEEVRLDGAPLQSKEDCQAVILYIKWRKYRDECQRHWDALMPQCGAPKFDELEATEPERVAQRGLQDVRPLLKWSRDGWDQIEDLLKRLGTSLDCFVETSQFESDEQVMAKTLEALEGPVLDFVSLMKTEEDLRVIEGNIQDSIGVLSIDANRGSAVCGDLLASLQSRDSQRYKESFASLTRLLALKETNLGRVELLARLDAIAPRWADAVRHRDGVHGGQTPPRELVKAWKLKQISMRLEQIAETTYSDLQKRAVELGKQYRTKTAELASLKGWAALLKTTETDLDKKQALQGWLQTERKIGKGTGKRAPKYRELARKQMALCQRAVPAWIMTINDALESLDPGKNRFDVVIVDEASQASVSALAVLFMAKKAIVVGDDRQVSPMDIGVDSDQAQRLISAYLDGIPNKHLYTTDTSLYDIAATTFKPLMLREHFRCVPDIIRFSNMLSYDLKIKPLRDGASSGLLPAVISQHVEDGVRARGKTNEAEAKEIVCLMKACMEQPEYDGRTFGAISLLGNEQSKLIETLAFNHIETKELEKRQFLCGSAADFQGDERDVIWLSLVDARNSGGGRLRMLGEGKQGAYKKRYNVATSRAKDQLWVVSSLDPANDLKKGDLRKRLLDYAANPSAYQEKLDEIDAKSESPFEKEVAGALFNRGFKIMQQQSVGAYRIDIVAECSAGCAAIECDGERWHSGEEAIRSDMERQAILERAGWRFVRLRGSEYYCDKKAAIERVVSSLAELGIRPDDPNYADEASTGTELLHRVRSRAARLRVEMFGEEQRRASDDDRLFAQSVNGTSGQ